MEVEKNKIYRHFKGDLYLVEDRAINVETEEEVVIYRGLYENCKMYTRSLNNFVEVLSKEQQDKYGQEYRFVLMEIESKNKKD